MRADAGVVPVARYRRRGGVAAQGSQRPPTLLEIFNLPSIYCGVIEIQMV